MQYRVRGFIMYSGDDTRARWELIYYWDEGATVECRYFSSMKEAERYAEHEGIPKEDYSIVPHNRK